MLAFNLSAELVYTNVLNCIDLAGRAGARADRGPEHPLVVAGGHCTYNPEPLADFVDFFVHRRRRRGRRRDHRGGRRRGRPAAARGSRERGAARAGARSRVSTCRRCTTSTYDGAALVGVTPRYADVPERVEKRTVADLADWPYPKHQLVPLTEVVHDRLNVEVFRGCTRGCRFCQAGMITRPVRERPAEQVRTMIDDGLRRTGYDEVTLTSLSTADFSGIESVVADTINEPRDCGQVSVSLPSLRVDAFTVGLAARDPEGAPHRPHVRARGRHVAHAAGASTS